MTRAHVDQLLARIGVLRHPSDLALLLFFARHSRTLVTSEQLAIWVGYESTRIADSLEVLLAARRLILHGELLQLVGDRILRENHRTRQYEETARPHEDVAVNAT